MHKCLLLVLLLIISTFVPLVGYLKNINYLSMHIMNNIKHISSQQESLISEIHVPFLADISCYSSTYVQSTVEGTGKVVFVHVLKAYRRHSSTHLNLSTRWWSVVSPCTAHLTPRERAPSTYWTEGWVGPRASLVVLEKTLLPQLGFKLQIMHPHLVTIPTKLSQFLIALTLHKSANIQKLSK